MKQFLLGHVTVEKKTMIYDSSILTQLGGHFVSLDENVFFRQASLRLFKDIEEEAGLANIHAFLKAFMPIAAITLLFYEYDSGQLRTVATFGEPGWPSPPDLVRLSQEEQQEILVNRGLSTRVRLALNFDREPFGVQAFLRRTGPSDSPVMHMRMEQRGGVGMVVAHAGNGGNFLESHQALLRVLAHPFSWAVIGILRNRELSELQTRLEKENTQLYEGTHSDQEGIIGAEVGLKRVMDQVRQVAPMDSTVLILGETGVGKEIIANALHARSNRHNAPFIKVNCGAIPEGLVDSELFGHERGAFTGALSLKKGWFERAHKGTIFLDEIGELPLSAQVRLLRVLQQQEFERVGGTKSLFADVRVIAATHRDLGQLIREGRFRDDLFFRLNVFPISIPPLRQRLNDIPALVDHFIKKKTLDMGLSRTFSPAPETIEGMIQYPWPGNVRELENVVERELIRSNSVPGEAFIYFGRNTPARNTAWKQPPAGHIVPLGQAMTRHIKMALIKSEGRVEGPKGAADILGVNPSTLRGKMRKLGIPFGRRTKNSNSRFPGQ